MEEGLAPLFQPKLVQQFVLSKLASLVFYLCACTSPYTSMYQTVAEGLEGTCSFPSGLVMHAVPLWLEVSIHLSECLRHQVRGDIVSLCYDIASSMALRHSYT